MEIRILHIRARCTRCGVTQFLEPHRPPYRVDDEFLCIECGRAQSYAALLDQIGEEATRQARGALYSLREATRRNR